MAMLAVSIFLYPTFSAGQTGTQVSYPDGYRLWTHIKSMVIEKGHPLYDSFGGIHHIYANKEAFHALKKGNHFLMGLFLFLISLRQKAMTTLLSRGNESSLVLCRKIQRCLATPPDGDLRHLRMIAKNDSSKTRKMNVSTVTKRRRRMIISSAVTANNSFVRVKEGENNDKTHVSYSATPG
jgi:hypothetical protein